MNDATFKLRVPTSELQEWKRKAGDKPLSHWIRDHCNETVESVEAQPHQFSEEQSALLVLLLDRFRSDSWQSDVKRRMAEAIAEKLKQAAHEKTPPGSSR